MTCVFDGSEYSDGALICVNGRELRCSGGEWQETGYACIMQEGDVGGYGRILDGGLRISAVSDPAPLLPCVRFIVGAPPNLVRLYNSCDRRKIATVAWRSGEVDRHTVDGDDYIDIQNRNSGAEIVGERDA